MKGPQFLLLTLAAAATAAASPVPAHPKSECCRCIIVIPPNGGDPYQGCPCQYSQGGTGCNISGLFCKTLDKCP